MLKKEQRMITTAIVHMFQLFHGSGSKNNEEKTNQIPSMKITQFEVNIIT